jgi:DNA-binding CsgD family transcriptional regulator
MNDKIHLFDLIDDITRPQRMRQGHELLRMAAQDMGLSHVAYAAINLPNANADHPLTAVTYSPEWERHYLQQGYVNLDPVVQAGLNGILPFDWASFDYNDPTIIRFFGEAKEFDIGSRGLSIPIRGRHGEFALFSVTSDLKDKEWESLKHRMMRELMVVAYYFHDWALRTEGVISPETKSNLTIREKDILRWRGLGKSDWDISQILGISQSTVKFHLENARHKLGAMNTTHALAKALSHGLIVMP